MSSTPDRQAARPTVVVAGAGTTARLAALHLARTAGRRTQGLDLVLVDPDLRRVRSSTPGADDQPLNVPATALSVLPEDPGHFVAWRTRQASVAGLGTDRASAAFPPRAEFDDYLADTLREALEAADVRPREVRARVVGVRRTARGVRVTTSVGSEIAADALVVAPEVPDTDLGWAPDGVADSAFFVPDPWAPGALDVVRRSRTGPGDVLLVGTGLVMVDVALALADDARADRVLRAVSRSGRLPRAHTAEPRLAAIPDISDWGHSLDEVRAEVRRHVEGVARSTGDWRPAVDGLRHQTAALWERLDEADRERFLSDDAAALDLLRHRVAPSSATVLRELQRAGRLVVTAGEVASADPLPTGGLRVTLADGSSVDVGWVVNCLGGRRDVRTLGDPLVDDLLRPRGGAALATPATAGLGFRTDQGRLVDAAGTTDAPLWTLGALRRGELWESTAITEVRSQARAVATAVLDAVAPQPRTLADGREVSGHHPAARPRDPLGLPLSTTAQAAAAYNAGLERVMRLQSGGDDLIREATELDPGFALAHAALAMLGHEAGCATDVAASLAAARHAVRQRGDDRERSLVDVVGRRVRDVRRSGAEALMAHIARYPRDVLAVSAAVPTIAFSGVTDVQQEAWDLVDGLAPAYGDHWWYISLLAFTRQDQSRFEEAGLLAESALSCEPSSGHAVHAQTHVLYETGQHEPGRVWLDHWVAESGRAASHRAHFSWHAALHELAVGDTEAVRRRYYSQLAPPSVTGVRALIDSASLLWRWRLTTSDWDAAVAAGPGGEPVFDGETAPPPIEPVLEAVDPCFLAEPETPFVAMHAALALAAAGRLEQLDRLGGHCRRSNDMAQRTAVATVCDALMAAGVQEWGQASGLLEDVLPILPRVGGSAAQREIVEETLLFSLVNAGEAEKALALLDARLDRRTSPIDARRRRSLSPSRMVPAT